MNATTWIILGATSVIANEFAHCAASGGHPLILVGRNIAELEIISADIRIRHRIECEVVYCDFAEDISNLKAIIQQNSQEFALFIAYGYIAENGQLTSAAIETLITTNVLSIVQLINAYLQKAQQVHRLIFLSSVAACKGRSKNSLYGASKAAIEIYLQGIQQTATPTQHITIARLGFIDTIQTFGSPGIFYASPPKTCAKACWKANFRGQRQFYHPFFWRYIMAIITRLPFFIYRRLRF